MSRIDELAVAEGMDRTELASRLLSDGLAQHRLRVAVTNVAAGRRSAWGAAERAGVSLYEMLDRVAGASIPYRLDPEVIERIRLGRNELSVHLGSSDGSRPSRLAGRSK